MSILERRQTNLQLLCPKLIMGSEADQVFHRLIKVFAVFISQHGVPVQPLQDKPSAVILAVLMDDLNVIG